MEKCDVCCERLNRIHHKKVECPFCDLISCRTCSQKYILSTHKDPHCMGCKHPWNREFVDSFCTKQFRNTDLRVHRGNVLFDRERARMPETQPEVERILRMRKLRERIYILRDKLVELHFEHATFEHANIHPTILEMYARIENTQRQLEELRDGHGHMVGESVKFIRQCPHETCKGFLTKDWYCGLCDARYCKACNELLVDGHTCDPMTVDTMRLLNADSKSCPKCGTVIHKTSGCAQMWCVDCHTAFDWRTGEIDTGRIHNPHFIEFKQKTIISREHGDIPCGGIPSLKELHDVVPVSYQMIQCAIAIQMVQRDMVFVDTRPVNNILARVAYMLNDIDEPRFKIFLQRQEKSGAKNRDVFNIYEMVTHAGGDLLRQFVIDPTRHDEIIDTIRALVEYGNEVFESIRKRYTCATPKNIYI